LLKVTDTETHITSGSSGLKSEIKIDIGERASGKQRRAGCVEFVIVQKAAEPLPGIGDVKICRSVFAE
jgi:hypothetical protein